MAATIKIVVESSGGIGPIRKDIEGLGTSAQGAGGGFTVMKGLAVNALTAVAGAAIEATKSVVGFAVDSVKAAGDFEAGLNQFRAIAGDSLAEAGFSMQDVSEKALQLGEDTKFSAGEALDALTELAKGGVPVKDLMGDATQATLDLAAAASMELAPAAEIVSKQLGVWGDTGVTATNVADLLSQAANASEVDVAGLGLALANAGGSAKVAGLGFQETVQALALIAPNFASAADAGTSFKTFVSRLIPTTDNATNAMIALGLATEDGKSKFFDATGSFIGMENAANLLQAATANLSQEEKLLAFNTIFGSDAIRAAAAVAEAGGDKFRQMGVDMAGVGTAAQQAGQMNEGFNAITQALGGSIETLQIRIGSLLLPILSDLTTNYLVPAVNSVSQFVSAISATGDPIAALGAAIMSVIPQFSANNAAVTQLSGVLDLLLTVATNVFNGYMAIINAALPIVAGFIAAHGAEISAFFTQTWNTMVEIATMALQTYNAIVPPVLQAIAAFISAHGSEITAILSGAWQIITSLITGTLATIKGIFQAALALLKGDWQGAWEAIKGIGEAQFNAIVGVITGAWGIIKGIFSSSIADLISVWSGAFSQLVSIVQKINWAALGTSIINGLVEGVKSAAGRLASAAVAAVEAAKSAAMSAIGMGSPAVEFMPIGKSMVDGVAKGIKDNTKTAEQAISDAMDGVLEKAKGKKGDKKSPIAAAVNSIVQPIKSISTIKPIAAAIIDPIQQIMDAALDLGKGITREEAQAYLASSTLASPSAGAYGNVNRTENKNRTLNYSPTINNYGGRGGAMDFALANSLAQV